ncbi:MAG: hypothetical protein ACLFVJ_08975 [Persicimonas sp.]
MKRLSPLLMLAAACLLVLSASPALAGDDGKTELAPDQFEWSTSRAELKAAIDGSVNTEHFGDYHRLTRSVTLDDKRWRQFFVFHKDKLIAQGYDRAEQLKRTRVGTISDAVSYDNNYSVVKTLTSTIGEPAYVNERTKRDYSQELGDDALKTERSLGWDLLGERFRWETDDGTIRYTVQYSMDGKQTHRLVNVNPGNWDNYFEFQNVQAFRKAGIRLIRRFRKRTQTWVVTDFGSGRVEVEKYSAPGSAKPKSAERDQWSTSNCQLAGQKCELTFKYYGGHLYQVDLDFSRSGEFGRRAHHEEVGKAIYKHFTSVDDKLRSRLGKPGDAKRIDDLDNRRSLLKVENLVQGQEGFWSAWYDVGNDVLVRHTISGANTGTGWEIDHKVTFRFHNVARSLAEQDEWKVETAKARK